jgi:hypothetical protein
MPRFVILEHDHPNLHWDFMLEAGGRLRTWRLAEPPGAGPSVPAEPIADHRPAYLDYEGPVSGDRGTVRRWDAGEFEWVADEATRLVVRLDGARVRGRFALVRDEGGRWTLQSLAAQEGGLNDVRDGPESGEVPTMTS